RGPRDRAPPTHRRSRPRSPCGRGAASRTRRRSARARWGYATRAPPPLGEEIDLAVPRPRSALVGRYATTSSERPAASSDLHPGPHRLLGDSPAPGGGRAGLRRVRTGRVLGFVNAPALWPWVVPRWATWSSTWRPIGKSAT